MTTPSSRRVVYVGNFQPAYSTENQVARAFRDLGHEIVEQQENQVCWDEIPALVEQVDADLLLWTRTWNLPAAGQAEQVGYSIDAADRALDRLADLGVPTIGFHLDRWWDLERQGQIDEQPWFRCRTLVTADGGHDPEWAAAGIDHVWAPPAVAGDELDLMPAGSPEIQFPEIVFVGSYPYPHPAWAPYREQLVDTIGRAFPGRFRIYPGHGKAIRGAALNRLLRSATVVVGDSCLVPRADGQPVARYWSDRIPETLGRGGCLIHPWVAGLDDEFQDGWQDGIDSDGDLLTYPLGEFDVLVDRIQELLDLPGLAREIARNGSQTVRDRHTYHQRAELILAVAERATPAGKVRLRGGSSTWASFPNRTPDVDDVVDEVWRQEVYAATSPGGAVVLDVGANVGAFSLWAAARGATRVVAVEPVPENLEQLRANVAANPHLADRIEIVDAATGAYAVGPVRVFADGPRSRLLAGAGDDLDPDRIVETRAIPFRDLLATHRPDVVKMDAEGAEYPAFLLGPDGDLGALLGDSVDRVVLEWHSRTDDVGAEFWIGRLVARFLTWGQVSVFGHPATGGYLTASRYRP